MRAGTILLLAGVAVAPALQAQASYRSDSAAIAAAARAFSAAYVANDTMALGALYVDSAVALPVSRDLVGRAAIRHYFAWPEGYRQVAHSLTLERLTIEGDIAVDLGRWHSTGQRGDNPPAAASGRYLVVWVRTPEGWKMLYDMWHPPPPNR